MPSTAHMQELRQTVFRIVCYVTNRRLRSLPPKADAPLPPVLLHRHIGAHAPQLLPVDGHYSDAGGRLAHLPDDGAPWVDRQRVPVTLPYVAVAAHLQRQPGVQCQNKVQQLITSIRERSRSGAADLLHEFKNHQTRVHLPCPTAEVKSHRPPDCRAQTYTDYNCVKTYALHIQGHDTGEGDASPVRPPARMPASRWHARAAARASAPRLPQITVRPHDCAIVIRSKPTTHVADKARCCVLKSSPSHPDGL